MFQGFRAANQPLFRRAVLGAANAWVIVAYADSRRRWLYLQNVADEAIEVGFGTDTVSPDTGAVLGKPSAADVHSSGGIFEAAEGEAKFTRQAIWARGVTGGKTLLIGLTSGDSASDVPAAPGADISSSSSSHSSASSASASSVSASSASASSITASLSSASVSSSSSRSASSLSSVSASSASSASSVSTSSYSSASSSSSSSTGP